MVSTRKQSFYRLSGELFWEDDSGEEDFDGEKTCLKNITMENYPELEGSSRCPNLMDKSANQFFFRIVLYLVVFGMNVILVNILIGQISKTLNKVEQDNNEYYLNKLELQAGFFEYN